MLALQNQALYSLLLCVVRGCFALAVKSLSISRFLMSGIGAHFGAVCHLLVASNNAHTGNC